MPKPDRYHAVFKGASIQAELGGWWAGNAMTIQEYYDHGAKRIHNYCADNDI